VYALEGSIAVAGSGVKFLMNNMGFITHSHKISDLAASVEDNGGCVFVTAFSGLFAPYWIDDAKGTIFGITQFTEQGHIARATLEATCFQTKAILDAMEKDSGHKLNMLAVDGGMSNSNLCMQVSGLNDITPRLKRVANILHRHKRISSASPSTAPPCGKRPRLVPLSQRVSQWTYGRSSTSSRRSTRKTGWSSSPTSPRRMARRCSRSGKCFIPPLDIELEN
jgi:hypothetical protein